MMLKSILTVLALSQINGFNKAECHLRPPMAVIVVDILTMGLTVIPVPDNLLAIQLVGHLLSQQLVVINKTLDKKSIPY